MSTSYAQKQKIELEQLDSEIAEEETKLAALKVRRQQIIGSGLTTKSFEASLGNGLIN